jgi:hypothetical protein
MGRMDAKETKQSGGGAAVPAVTVLVLVLLPVIYVASLGPVVWLVSRDFIDAGPESIVAIIYAPLQNAADHSPFIERALMWYGGLFREQPLGTVG